MTDANLPDKLSSGAEDAVEAAAGLDLTGATTGEMKGLLR